MSKTLHASSESGTVRTPGGGIDAFDVAIGETLTFRLEAVLPESTSISISMSDVLDSRFAWVPGSARVSFVANSAPSFNGDFAGIQNESTPTFAFPASRVNFDAGSSRLTFDFGSVINNDGDADDELLIVHFDAVVRDLPTLVAGATIPNQARFLVDEGLPTETGVTSAAVNVRVVEPALRAGKTFAPDLVTRGGTTTLTLTANNLAINGATAAAQDVRLTDTLDDWLDVTGVTVTFNAAATTFGSTFADQSTLTPGFASGVQDALDVRISGLPVDGVATVTVTLQVDPNANPTLLPRTITNQVDATADSLSTDVDPDDQDRAYSANASDDLGIVKPSLRLSMTDSNDPVAAGAPYSYTATLQNTGVPAVSASGVTLTLQLPTGYSASAGIPSQGSCGAAVAGQVSCALGNIAPGASVSVQLDGRMAADSVSGTVVDTVGWATSNEGNDGSGTPGDNDDERAAEPTTIVREVDLSIQKSASDATPTEREPFTFDLVVNNSGPSDASGVVVTDTLPAGLSFLGVAPPGVPCTYAAPTLTCTVATLAAGASTTISLQTSANTGTGGSTIVNKASVTGTEPDSTLANDSDDATVTPEARAPMLALDKTGTINFGVDGMASAGDAIQYGFAVSNTGNATLSGVTISDPLLSGITCPGGHPIASLAPGARVDCTGTYALTQADVDAGHRDNTAGASVSDGGNTYNATDSHQISYTPFADLSLGKTVNAAVAISGQSVTFTLVLTNAGPAAASSVVVVDTLPAGLAWVSDSCGSGPAIGNQWIWQVGVLAAGASISCEVTTRVDVDTEAALINTAIATSTTADPSPAQSATASATLAAYPASRAIPFANAATLLALIGLMLVAGATQLYRSSTRG